ncbi:hypothetical protein AW27_002750 [Streptomyces sp. PCS3-D2]|uniref:hypothetical protein n=1 Tax=Streptomyces sp. PCS3-D2 TaxID=1460244 RepID=UPI00044BBE72|nr:hypothetical protein [Streptomyces sp. PCS3-D2]WKV70528.1 hypothetical protein AW27_002750 [Streptomyces sp. PCS3-D2]
MNDEPVFVRHTRTRRYVYNPRNAVGRAFIVIAPLVAIGMLSSLYAGWHWSEGELRTAVRQAADALNARPHYASGTTAQDDLVRSAVKETGTGPGHGLTVRGNGATGYTISTDDTTTEFCMHVTLTPVAPDEPYPSAFELHHVTATVDEGACRQP